MSKGLRREDKVGGLGFGGRKYCDDEGSSVLKTEEDGEHEDAE